MKLKILGKISLSIEGTVRYTKFSFLQE